MSTNFHRDKHFMHLAEEFRNLTGPGWTSWSRATNVQEALRKYLVRVSAREAELLNQLNWLKRPDPPEPPPVELMGFGPPGLVGPPTPYHFGNIAHDEDAITWLNRLGALRLKDDEKYQCHWATCLIVSTTDDWKYDVLHNHGRSGHKIQPPCLYRGSYLLRKHDATHAKSDWSRHIACLINKGAADAVNAFTRARMREQSFYNQIFRSLPVPIPAPILHRSV